MDRTTHPPIDEWPDLDERMALALQARDKIRTIGDPLYHDFELNLFQLTAFLAGDIDSIRSFLNLDSGVHILYQLANVESFLAKFLQQDRHDVYKHRPQALQREGNYCAFTKTLRPDVCPIWPVAINVSHAHRDILERVLAYAVMILGNDLKERLEMTFATGHANSRNCDHLWNMLSMARDQHHLWRQAHFGLRWVENCTPVVRGEHATFQVEWRWLPYKLHDALDHYLSPGAVGPRGHGARIVYLSDEAVTGIKQAIRGYRSTIPYSASHPDITAKHAVMRNTIETGQIFNLKVKTVDLQRTKALIQAQWIAVCMANWSGAAEVAYDLRCNPPPLPESQRTRGRGLRRCSSSGFSYSGSSSSSEESLGARAQLEAGLAALSSAKAVVQKGIQGAVGKVKKTFHDVKDFVSQRLRREEN